MLQNFAVRQVGWMRYQRYDPVLFCDWCM